MEPSRYFNSPGLGAYHARIKWIDHHFVSKFHEVDGRTGIFGKIYDKVPELSYVNLLNYSPISNVEIYTPQKHIMTTHVCPCKSRKTMQT